MTFIQVLTTDHEQVQDVLCRIDLGELSPTAPEVDQMARELSVHAALEEVVVYPAVDKLVPGGENFVEQHLREHQLVKNLLVEIEHAGADDRRLLISALAVYVRAHVRREEGKLFPALCRHASEEQLADMSRSLERARSVAPTHPHPHAPRTPPANVVADAAASLLDRARDGVASRRRRR
jgi:hemerythrin-like domain-containing protein